MTLGTNKRGGLKAVSEIIDEGGGVDGILNPSSDDGPEVAFQPLAKMIPRWERGRTTVIVAPTGGGKSSLARQEALGVAERGGTVAVFSLEMSNAETLRAMVCTAAAVNNRKLQLDRTTEAERARLLQTVNRLEQGGIYIADSVSTVGEIAVELRKLKAKRGAVDLCVVDYLQLVKHLGKAGTRTEAVDAISRGLKALAMAERVPLLILAQWNNEGAKAASDGGEPGAHQIRESGSISQDADRLVYLVPKKADPGFTPEIVPYRLIVKKNRNGPQGAVEIGFDGALTRFVEADGCS